MRRLCCSPLDRSTQTTLEELQQMIPEDMLKYCLKHDMLRGIFIRKRGVIAIRKDGHMIEPKAKRYKRTQL